MSVSLYAWLNFSPYTNEFELCIPVCILLYVNFSIIFFKFITCSFRHLQTFIGIIFSIVKTDASIADIRD